MCEYLFEVFTENGLFLFYKKITYHADLHAAYENHNNFLRECELRQLQPVEV